MNSVAFGAVVVADRRARCREPTSVVSSAGEDHRHGRLDAALADLVAVDVERRRRRPCRARRRRRRTPSAPGARRRAAARSPSTLNRCEAEEVVAVGRPALVEVEAPAAEGAALGDDHALAAALGHHDLRRHRVRLVLDDERPSSPSAGPCRRRAAGSCPRTSCGRPAMSGLKRSTRRSSSGSTLYLAASIRNSRCSSAQLLGLLGGEVVGLGPVVGRVELPDVVVEGGQSRSHHPRDAVAGDRGPALVVDAAVARTSRSTASRGARARRRRRRSGPCSRRAAASAGRRGRRSASGSPAASSTVAATSITWLNWVRTSPLALIPFGQWTIVPLRVPPQCEATCLVHW